MVAIGGTVDVGGTVVDVGGTVVVIGGAVVVIGGTVDVGAGGSESVGGLHLVGPGGAGTATRRAIAAMNTARMCPAFRVRCT